MLEGLDAIDWSKLHHAYGPAMDVPQLIRDLASEDPGTRREAIHALYGNIWHQGTVYEASAPAVPFLIELLADGSGADLVYVLNLLADLATGSSYLDVHGRIITELRDEPDYQEQLAEELGWVRESREAVERGLPTYIRLLRQKPDRAVRLASAYVLGNCTGQADLSGEAIRSALLDESNEVARFGLILCLGSLGREADVAPLDAILPNDPSAPIRWAAANSLARILHERTPPEAVAAIAQAFAAPNSIDALLSLLPWDPDEAVEEARRSLELVGALAASNALIFGLPLVDGYNARSLVVDLLNRAFPKPENPPSTPPGFLQRLCDRLGLHRSDPPPRPFHELTAPQVAFLRAVANADHVWAVLGDTAHELRRRNLPGNQLALRRYLDHG